MAQSNFDKLYKFIMESAYNRQYNSADPGRLTGRLAYGTKSGATADSEVKELYGKWNGQPAVDAYGNPLKWQLNAIAIPCQDFITGLPLSEGTTTLWLRNGLNKGRGIHVALKTYEDAYATNDQATIAKLKALGLEPGYTVKY